MLYMKKILISLSENGQNGGPYISHKRIMESSLKNKYVMEAFFFPRIRKFINPLCFFQFVKQIKKSKADAMLVAGLQMTGFLLVLLCKVCRIKVILAVHGSSLENSWSRKRKIPFYLIEKATIKMSDMVYGVSDYVSSWDYFKKCPKYYGTIYNLIEIVKDDDVDWRKKLGINSNDIVIVSTGRVTKEKGFDVFWKMVQNIGHTSNIKYVVAGDGHYKEEWQLEIKKKQYEKEVFLVGYQKNIYPLLKISDAFVICTKHETLCISLLEAAMSRLPLIATNVGGIPEIIDDTCGFLVHLNDVESFSNVVKKLVDSASLRKKMGDNAYDKVSEKFDRLKIENQLDYIFSKTVNNK